MSALKKNNKLLPVGIFTLAYLIISALFSLQSANWEFAYYIAVVIILMAAVIAVHLHVNLSQGVLWALSIWGLLHMMGGLMPIPEGLPFNGDKAVFYSLWIIPDYLKYDHLIHAYGFGTATWVCWEALRRTLKITKPSGGVLVAIVLIGLGLGAVNEIVEFIAVLLIPNTNVGGYINTGWDLISNSVGCIVAAALIKYRS